ncbi:hypothetical protein ASZ78_000621 [Callipepla squamata]|uniref:Uncharacterized protein n=1 Tax=Callipepla squamata TaxID=9009 RepID=A0A226MUA9_CALSU|nr:hypothetical protein ASZ78_000621 [Callipepla squamata]
MLMFQDKLKTLYFMDTTPYTPSYCSASFCGYHLSISIMRRRKKMMATHAQLKLHSNILWDSSQFVQFFS